MRISRTGKVTVFTGASAMGQGLGTAMAQIAAAQLGVGVDKVTVVAGDTSGVSLGLGGFASRQTVTAGSSVHLAAKAVAEKAKKVASHILEAAEHDLELVDGEVRVLGAPQLNVKLGEIARILQGAPGYGFPPGVDPGLEANVMHRMDALSYANACHVVEVEVDAETGEVKILRYVAMQDSGVLINPMMVEGQIHGGVAHGIGNTFYEWMGYDDGAQPVTTTFADYLLPTATEVPMLQTLYKETRSPLNPLGVKGVGEAGTIPAAAALISAVEDALSPFNVRIGQVPLAPMKIVETDPRREARLVFRRRAEILRSHQHKDPDRGQRNSRSREHFNAIEHHIALPLPVLPQREGSDPLFYHLIRPREQPRRHGEAQHPRGLRVDDQLEFVGLHHRNVRRHGAFENTAGVGAALAVGVVDVAAVAHEPARFDVVTHRECRWNAKPRRHDGELNPTRVEKRIGRNENPARRIARHGRKSRIDVLAGADVEHPDCQSDRAARRLHVIRHGCSARSIGRIDEHRDAGRTRHEFAHQFQTFPAHLGREEIDPGRIAARAGQALHQTKLDRVVRDHEYDRDRRRRRFGGQRRIGPPGRAYHRDAAGHQFSGQLGQPGELIVGEAKHKRHVLALDVTCLLQAKAKGAQAVSK